MNKGLVEYKSNNSGGSFWLSETDWKKLEHAGWKVKWSGMGFEWSDGNYTYGKDGIPIFDYPEKTKDQDRFLNKQITTAFKICDSLKEALEEFEKVTGQTVTDEGCNCCGPPHAFSWDNGKDREYCSGEDCVKFLYPDVNVPTNLREAAEFLRKGD